MNRLVLIESQGQVLDSLKDSPIQKECDALKQTILRQVFE